jgi:hypothetical protein
VRNPFDEYECGHFYARALASYGLLQGLTGVRYDAVDRTLYIEPRQEGDFRTFLSAATGYGTAGVSQGEPFLEVKAGTIEVARTVYNRTSPHPKTPPLDLDAPASAEWRPGEL